MSETERTYTQAAEAFLEASGLEGKVRIEPTSLLPKKTVTRVQVAAMALRAQVERDLVWCISCGYSGARELAVAYILVCGEGVGCKVPLCRACHANRVQSPLQNDWGSEPVEQPAWTHIATELLSALEASG